MRPFLAIAVSLLAILRVPHAAWSAAPADLLNGGFREASKAGWIPVHLEGSPAAIGYQHGYLLRHEIEDNQRAIALSTTHESRHSWSDLRKVSEQYFVPKLTSEYKDELDGIVSGLKDAGAHLDLVDLVAMNAYMEFSYYYDELKRRDQQKPASVASSAGEHCSAFVATGSYTKDGRVVIGHNNWTDYLTGSRWNIIFDIAPATGHRFIMDGMPGLIHSADDFGINDAGIMITETTIGSFHGFDRERHAGICARPQSHAVFRIDRRFRAHHEGRQQRRICQHLAGRRSQDERDRPPGTRAEERHARAHQRRLFCRLELSDQPEAHCRRNRLSRHDIRTRPTRFGTSRWDQLMAENKGKIDVELGKKFETDHYDISRKKSIRTNAPSAAISIVPAAG